MNKTKNLLYFWVVMVLGAFNVSYGHNIKPLDEKSEITALREELEQLTARLDKAERKTHASAKVLSPAAAHMTATQNKKLRESFQKDIQDAFVGTLPNSFKVPGFSTSIAPDGFIKLDMIADRKVSPVDPAYNYVLSPYIPVAGNPLHERRGETHFTARTSQLGFFTSTPVGDGTAIETRFNGDFLGYTDVGTELITNHYYFRMRYAYIKWNGWLFGQNDTNFRDMGVKTETVDPLGPGAMASYRQVGVQYTWKPRAGVLLMIGLENPEADYLEKTGKTIKRRNTMNGLVTTEGFGLDLWPDLATQLRIEWGGGHLSFRGILRDIRVKDGITRSQRTTGGGVGFSGHYKVFGKDKILWCVNYGRGIGRYIVDLFGQGAVYDLDKGTMRPITSLGLMAGYQHYWTSDLRSSVLWSMSRSYNPGDLKITGQEVNRLMRTGHINLIWTPVPRWDIGIEASFASRKVEDARHGIMHRYQTMVRYRFD